MLPLLFQQRSGRGPQVGCGAVGEAFVPFASRQFTFDGGKHDVTERTLVSLRIATQALMQGIGYIFDLEICRSMNIACLQHAVKG